MTRASVSHQKAPTCAIPVTPLADLPRSCDYGEMSDAPFLLQPHVRRELQNHLLELQTADPRPAWRAERDSGLLSGIDQVFHFLFDDHDFDESAIGVSLFGEPEVRVIAAVKRSLEAVLTVVGDADDDVFVVHPLWVGVRRAAIAAMVQMAFNRNGD